MPSYAKTTARRAAGRSRRRVLVLAAVVATLMVAGAIAYTVRSKQIDRRLAADRDEGIVLIEQGEYDAGLKKIRDYVGRNKDDVDALLPYAKARAQVEMPGYKHLLDAIEIFRRVLELDPDNAEARRHLLSLYVRTGSNRDVLKATEGRDDALSLQARAIAHGRLREVDKAIAAVSEYARLVPTDYRMQRYAIALLDNEGRGDEALERVDALEDRIGPTTGLALLRVAALQSSGRPDADEDANVALRSVVAGLRDDPSKLLVEPPDVVRELVGRLDAAKAYDDAEWALLTYAAADEVAPAPDSGVLADTSVDDSQHTLRALAMERLLATGRAAEAKQYAADWVAAAPNSVKPRLAALGRLAGADVAGADGTPWQAFADAVANAGWLDNLDAATTTATLDDVAAGNLLTAVRGLPSDQSTALAEQAAGDALAKLGELRAALVRWQSASALAPWWVAPQRAAADAFTNVGRPQDALDLAGDALDRNPDDPATRRVHARAIVLNETASLANLQRAAEEFDALAEAGMAELLPLRVLAWERAGRPDWAAQLLSAAAGDAATPTPMLADAMPTARRVGGAALDDVVAALEARREQPEALEALAVHAARTGDAAAAAEMVANLPDEPHWQRVRATILSGLNEPGAARAWQQVADAMPDDLGVQRRALGEVTRPAEADDLGTMPAAERLAFAERAAGRVTERVGAGNDVSVALPLARALLAAADGDQARLGDAAVRLQRIVDANPKYLEARLLLADSLLRIGNDEAANNELQEAVEIAPNDLGLRLALAERLLEAGEASEADRLLNLAVRQIRRDPESATSRDRQQLAQLLNRRGSADEAVQILANQGNSPADAITRARVLLRADRLSDGDVTNLLAVAGGEDRDAAVRVAAHEVALRYAVRRGDAARRDAALAQLNEIAQNGGQGSTSAELILAANDRTAGQPDAATERFERVTKQDPADARGWSGLALTALADGDAARTRQLAQTAAERVESNVARDAFASVAAALDDGSLARAVRESAVSRNLVAATLPDVSTGRPGVAGDEARRDVLRAATLANSGDAAAADELSALARQYPLVRPLALAVVTQLVDQMRWADVLNAGGRAVESFPGDADLARLTAVAAEKLGETTQAAVYAQRWADWATDPDDARRANIFAATALINARDPRSARDRLRPYVADLSGDSVEAVLRPFAFAAAELGDWDDVRNTLLPYAGEPAVLAIVEDLADQFRIDPRVADELMKGIESESAQNLPDRVRSTISRLVLAEQSGNAASFEGELLALADAAVADRDQPTGLVLVVAVGLQRAATEATLKRAGEVYREVLERDSGNTVAAANLAQLILNDRANGTVDEAIRLARSATDGAPDPQASAAFETLAGLLLKQGDTPAAVDAATRATERAPRNGLAHLRLAEARLAAGDDAGASAALRTAEQLGPPQGVTELDAFDARVEDVKAAVP